ncbi:crossover junction endonuclease MUS81 [Sarcophilus harrisii]|uniref:crossover junction endonuclease MUS81 n=1 Tax=Sarcophilus harrisii TaxID=9305 RepID=UPI001301EC17|nr:crossover junction endonuclease MUS81 [Sarcophilus harrisii]
MAATAPRLGRKRPLPACANPLFVRWLREWRDEAADRGLRTRFVYQKALRSLLRYPLPLRSGKEAKILQHFGDALCRMLDRRLEQHRAAGPAEPGLSQPPDPGFPPGELRRPPEEPGPGRPKAGGRSSYRPPRHSAARAVLLILYREQLDPESPGSLSKEELLQRCEQEAPRGLPSGRGEPWPALRALLHRNLIQSCQWPARYSLTPAGLELSRELAEAEAPEEPPASLRPRSAQSPCREAEHGPQEALARLARAPELPLELRPGEYRILLCVDVSETTGGSRRPDILRELQHLGVPHDVRKLHVGDFVWVAQETRPRDPTRPAELVLDHVVERKRLDDLCGSITDGRFREQKVRGPRARTPLDLSLGPFHPGFSLRSPWAGFESHSRRARPRALGQASAGAQPRVYRWEDPAPTTLSLEAPCCTNTGDRRLLCEAHGAQGSHASWPSPLALGRSEICCRPWGDEGDPGAQTPPCSLFAFSTFNDRAMKNKAQSVREVFARQLMQVRGMSGEKAAALLGRPAPPSLLAAYDACASPQDRGPALPPLPCRNLGPALSRTLCQLYCTPGPLP